MLEKEYFIKLYIGQKYNDLKITRHLTLYSKMMKITITGNALVTILLIINVIGLYTINLILPNVTVQYFESALINESHKNILYYIHPFIISKALSWFWVRYKSALTGSFINKGILNEHLIKGAKEFLIQKN